MKNSGNELNDLLKIKDLTFFYTANEQHFARKMMSNYAPKRIKMLHLAKNEPKTSASQALKMAVVRGLHELRGSQGEGHTNRFFFSVRSASASLGPLGWAFHREFTMSKIVGTNSTSLLESVKLEKNELKTNTQ